MMLRTFLWMVTLLTVFNSCTEKAPIDRQYLESQEYRAFDERQKQEFAQKIDSYNSLKKFLNHFGQCSLGKEWTFPFELNRDAIAQNRFSCKQISQNYETTFTAQSIGYSTFENVTVRWILIDKETGYTDIELLALSYRDSALVSFKTVGLFQENLKRNVSTELSVSRKGGRILIESSINRGNKYPFKYDNVIQTTFLIDSTGVIEKQS